MPSFDSTVIPSLNLVLGVIVLFLLLDTMARRWNEFPYEVKLLHFLSMSLLFGLLVVSGAQLAEHRPVSFDTLVITLTKLTALFITWKTRKTLYRTGERHEGDLRNKDSDDPNRDIVA